MSEGVELDKINSWGIPQRRVLLLEEGPAGERLFWNKDRGGHRRDNESSVKLRDVTGVTSESKKGKKADQGVLFTLVRHCHCKHYAAAAIRDAPVRVRATVAGCSVRRPSLPRVIAAGARLACRWIPGSAGVVSLSFNLRL